MVCNKQIKWFGLLEGARLLEGAKMLGVDAIATGHYAQTSFSDGRHRLYKGVDGQKDQSYFLWMLSQADLAKTVLPLGELTKPEVRAFAHTFGVRAAEKKESQEICFVPNDDYCAYLANAIPELTAKVADGEIVNDAGQIIGKHRGYPFYTIGQRRGLGVSAQEPLYVTGLDAKHNRVHVGKKSALESRRLIASELNWIGIDKLTSVMETFGRIRYRDKEALCTIEPSEENSAIITFNTAKSAVTTGQAIVFYRENELLGGGIIADVLPE
jgi:tRNA-specific 2-thiouridylase